MQKYKNQRVFPCIFEQKLISEQIDLILAHCEKWRFGGKSLATRAISDLATLYPAHKMYRNG